MEKRALVVALALTLPLALYGVPYAYAAGTQSTYVVQSSYTGVVTGERFVDVMCSSPSDFTLHFTTNTVPPTVVASGIWLNSGGNFASTGDIPNGWRVIVDNTGVGLLGLFAQITCQSPITVAGIGVPQFGSLYVAIALGAVVYFILSRRFSARSTTTGRSVVS